MIERLDIYDNEKKKTGKIIERKEGFFSRIFKK